MPIYEYKCDNCQKIHEIIQKFSDAPLELCPECNQKVEKIVSLSSFALKGSGWYTTDYKKSSSQKPSTSAAEASCAKPECKTVCATESASQKPTSSVT